MSTFSSIHFSFPYGTSRYTWNLASVASRNPSDELLSSRGIYLGPTTNNIVEYHDVIGLLTEEISLGITQMISQLHSQLVVF